jgi:hypothetical protein
MRTIERKCENCESLFMADPREVNRGNAKYCSLSCSSKNIRKNQEKIIKSCVVCNEHYETKDKNSKYCSSICKQRHYREKLRKDDNLSMKTYNRVFKKIGCEICGWNESTTDLHHIIPVSEGGINELNNLINVCPNHHRMIHKNLISEDKINEIIKNRSPIYYNDIIFDGKKKTYI